MTRLGALLRVLRRGPAIPAPMRVQSRHLPTLLGRQAMERWFALSRALPANIETLATLRAGSRVGCPW